MHINCCRWAAQPGPSAEPVSILQARQRKLLPKAPKNTGYREDVPCCDSREDGLARQGKSSLAACGSLLYMYFSVLWRGYKAGRQQAFKGQVFVLALHRGN